MANYVPIQSNSERSMREITLPHSSITQRTSHENTRKKILNYDVLIQTEVCEKSMPPRYTSHILSRRFALTPTSYKWLDIGIINAESILCGIG